MRRTSFTFKIIVALIVCALGFSALAGCKGKAEQQGNIKTINDLKPGDIYAVIKFNDFEGELTFILFDDIAPIAIKEFAMAANNRYYDGKTIHRVLKDTLFQGGALNPDGTDNTIPVEEMFEIETHTNARNFFGALCFANDLEEGMNYRQFYVVTANKPVDVDEQERQLKEVLDKATNEDFTKDERETFNRYYRTLHKIPTIARERYLERGGLPMLDGNVTVFGQLISGWELLALISSVDVVAGNGIDDGNVMLNNGKGQHSRPAESLFIESIRIIKIPLETEEE